jgi:hypothetical protein
VPQLPRGHSNSAITHYTIRVVLRATAGPIGPTPARRDLPKSFAESSCRRVCKALLPATCQPSTGGGIPPTNHLEPVIWTASPGVGWRRGVIP